MLFVFGLLTGLIVGAMITLILGIRGMNVYRKNIKKLKTFYSLLVNWVRIKICKKSICDYLEECGYQNIAIYGKKELGILLYEELKDSTVHVECFIDKDADYILSEIPIIKPEMIKNYQSINAIIVTAITYYAEIESDMKAYTKCPIISLKSVTNSVLRTVGDEGSG